MLPLIPAIFLLILQGLPGGDEICLNILFSSSGNVARNLDSDPVHFSQELPKWVLLKVATPKVVVCPIEEEQVQKTTFGTLNQRITKIALPSSRTRDGPVTA